MMGLHQLSPSRSFLVAYGTDDDPVERDSLGTAIGCLVHAGRLSNPRGNCQFKMNGPLRCYISETLTEPLRKTRGLVRLSDLIEGPGVFTPRHWFFRCSFLIRSYVLSAAFASSSRSPPTD